MIPLKKFFYSYLKPVLILCCLLISALSIFTFGFERERAWFLRPLQNWPIANYYNDDAGLFVFGILTAWSSVWLFRHSPSVIRWTEKKRMKASLLFLLVEGASFWLIFAAWELICAYDSDFTFLLKGFSLGTLSFVVVGFLLLLLAVIRGRKDVRVHRTR